MHFQGAMHGQTECDAGKVRGPQRGLPLCAIFSVPIQMALRSASSYSP
jgi:hypothetical protein